MGNRLFFTTVNSIQEYLPDGSLQLLASCRRRPAITALDNMDNYAPCHLFLDGQGRINVCASNELYLLSGTNDWQHYATLPAGVFFGGTLSEDGFVQPLREDWWGMFGPCQKPEILFRLPAPSRPGIIQIRPPVSQKPASAPRWLEPPPGWNACLDGDCLWFPSDSSQPTPGIYESSTNSSGALALVRYKYDEPHHIKIAVDLSEQEADAAQASNRPRLPNPSGRNKWNLTATPEGLAATHGTAGFWLIPREDLNRAVAEASEHHSANP